MELDLHYHFNKKNDPYTCLKHHDMKKDDLYLIFVNILPAFENTEKIVNYRICLILYICSHSFNNFWQF